MRTGMRNNEAGFGLVIVLILLALGSLLIAPVLRLTFTTLQAKQINTDILDDQYARDGAAEFGIWQLIYGGATTFLTDTDECPDNICTYDVVLNGISTTVTIRMRTELGTYQVPGAEDNKVRPTQTVICAINGSNFVDDCDDPDDRLPVQSGMVAKYTVSLEQVSPALTDTILAIYSELPKGFRFIPGSVTSPDGSFPEMLPEVLNLFPEDIRGGGEEILKWDLSSKNVMFEQGEIKIFTFNVAIDNKQDRYCNDIFVKMSSPPHEQSGKTAIIVVGGSAPDGCDGGGVKVEKFVDNQVAPPNVTTIFTYLINVENLDNTPRHMDSIKDVLPQGGFAYCSTTNPPTVGTCDDPMIKIVDAPFDPQTDSFTDTSAPYATFADPVETLNNGRWELFWDGPGGAGWNISAAGNSGDTFIMRFQAYVTPTESGSYFNEVFTDVDCSAPNALTTSPDDVTTSEDYCASYSWPTGGTLVPMYDVNSEADRTSGQGNVIVGGSGTTLESWHVDDL